MNARLAGIGRRTAGTSKSRAANPLALHSCRTRTVRVRGGEIILDTLELARESTLKRGSQRLWFHGRGHNGKPTAETAGPVCGVPIDTVVREMRANNGAAHLFVEAARGDQAVADGLGKVRDLGAQARAIGAGANSA